METSSVEWAQLKVKTEGERVTSLRNIVSYKKQHDGICAESQYE
jgi:hypothetical protein